MTCHSDPIVEVSVCTCADPTNPIPKTASNAACCRSSSMEKSWGKEGWMYMYISEHQIEPQSLLVWPGAAQRCKGLGLRIR